jgi:hypothetical protein
VNKWVIVDLDGTLVGCAKRDHHRAAGDWDAFHKAGCESDEIINSTADFIRTCYDRYNLMVLTGRNEKFRAPTCVWLSENNLAYFSSLLMRPDGDYRSDAELKIGLLEGFFGSKEKVLEQVAFCLDDRQKVIDGFREYGVACWEVNPGGY